MTVNIINAVITIVVSSAFGYCVSVIKHYKKKQQNIDKAFLILLKSNLTTTYYTYEKKQEIPDYVLQGWLDEYKVYEEFGGNTYMGVLKEKIVKFKIIHTDVLS